MADHLSVIKDQLRAMTAAALRMNLLKRLLARLLRLLGRQPPDALVSQGRREIAVSM